MDAPPRPSAPSADLAGSPTSMTTTDAPQRLRRHSNYWLMDLFHDWEERKGHKAPTGKKFDVIHAWDVAHGTGKTLEEFRMEAEKMLDESAVEE